MHAVTQPLNFQLIKGPAQMTSSKLNVWYQNNREVVDQLDSRYINNRILIVGDEHKEYKYICRKVQGHLV